MKELSTVTFNEQGDYVLAAVCRLDTKDLVWDNYLSLQLGGFSLFWQEKKHWAAQHPDLKPQEGKPMVSLSPTPEEEESCPHTSPEGLDYNPWIKLVS